MKEDIKILEELKNDFIYSISKKDEFIIERDKKERAIQAIENIINRNYYLENKATTEINNEINKMKVEILKKYIPIFLVEEILEELKKEREYIWEHNSTAKLIEINSKIKILQKLLETNNRNK